LRWREGAITPQLPFIRHGHLPNLLGLLLASIGTQDFPETAYLVDSNYTKTPCVSAW
jgi:hypothetical protein